MTNAIKNALPRQNAQFRVTDQEIIVKHENSSLLRSLRSAAKNAAILVAIVAVVVVALLALIGKVIEQWSTVLWALSLGGHFWGGFAVSTLGSIVAAWSLCTIMLLDEDGHSRAITWLKVTAGVSLVLALLAHTGLFWLWISGHFGTLSLIRVLALGITPTWAITYLFYRGYAAFAEHV